MNDYLTPRETSELEPELSALREVKSPATLMPRILASVGLADSYFSLATSIGLVCVAYNAHGISAVMPAEDRDTFEVAFAERFGRTAVQTMDPPASLLRSVTEHLEGRRRDLRFDLRGLSEFEQAVLRKALEIPRGEVRPYAWVAREIGRPLAVRAVGSALGRNPIPLLIPCHRVVRSGGEMGQYALGREKKRAVLESEGVSPAHLEDLARKGVRFIGSGTTKIYCFPTCRNARRITARHSHPFRSAAEAEAAGYRPCKVCRPIAVGA